MELGRKGREGIRLGAVPLGGDSEWEGITQVEILYPLEDLGSG